jgi:hypothetical protein
MKRIGVDYSRELCPKAKEVGNRSKTGFGVSEDRHMRSITQ